MIDFNAIKVEPKIKLSFGERTSRTSQGGDGGKIFIFAEEIQGEGLITSRRWGWRDSWSWGESSHSSAKK